MSETKAFLTEDVPYKMVSVVSRTSNCRFCMPVFVAVPVMYRLFCAFQFV